jgi:hypothetical protein
MKSMWKIPLAALILVASLLTLAIMIAQPAHASTAPSLVVNATGTVVYGTETVQMVKKDFSTQRTMIRYSGGWQYLPDDAAWSKYAKVVAALGNRALAVDGDPADLVVVVSLSSGIYCLTNQSVISISGYNQPEYLADGCNFWVKAKANAN